MTTHLHAIARTEADERARDAPSDPPDDYLTPNEVAKLLKVHVVTVRQWIRRGQLEAGHAGVRRRVSREALHAFLKRRGR